MSPIGPWPSALSRFQGQRLTPYHRPRAETQANVFGGVSGRAYDPCYHGACDTIDSQNSRRGF
jgi:hypothetical protein